MSWIVLSVLILSQQRSPTIVCTVTSEGVAVAGAAVVANGRTGRTWETSARPGGTRSCVRFAADGSWTVDGWAPVDGRVVNGGVRVQF